MAANRLMVVTQVLLLAAGCSSGRVQPPGIEDGGAGAVYTIRQLRDATLGQRPAAGTRVLVHGAVITAIRTATPGSYGFYIREGKLAYQAIFVYTAGQLPADSKGLKVQQGDLVSVRGKLGSFNEIDQLETPDLIVVSGNGDNTPVDVSSGHVAPRSSSADKYESQLVRLYNVQVTAQESSTDAFWVSESARACDEATPVCARISDFHYDGGKANGKPAGSKGARFSSITGVLSGFRGLHSVEPRDDADLVRK